ncbi:ubiquinol-cytochrome c reductase iron-sulfur subunit [Desulforhopalus singaporensis]|uniref:Rieske [2Fe-2S] domain-containing protein n=1 Tax=Desulforhopalus singaporensis TaxID=91360 RepID=A0A1H0MP64_9BACT|nr:Rieske (2Fe-2S) protein [Desulforhopalus singaporensis]SDO82095.1 Rieske [2Fe-2S] domain-containing protein [Desulforhopalus singaporensis]
MNVFRDTGYLLSRRAFFLFSTALAFAYPLFRFIGYRVPRKPTYVEVNKEVPASGYIVAEDFILFDNGTRRWALSRKCTHLGCRVNYHENREIIECPCHQSQFNASDGTVTRGPAKTPLALLPVEKKDNEPGYVVTT